MLSEEEGSAEAVGSDAEAVALDSADEVGSRERDPSAEGAGAKTPVLMDEVGLAVAEAEAESATEDGAADTETEAEAEGRVQARFLAMGVPSAGAARARTGRAVNRVENFIVDVPFRWSCLFSGRCVSVRLASRRGSVGSVRESERA